MFHRIARPSWLIGLSLLLVCGCGKPPFVPVTGTVTMNGQPLAQCKVGFFPDGEFDPDRSGYGFGITDAQGKYEIQHPQGEKGIYPGSYKITLVLWVDSKGNVLPFDTKPSEVKGGVKNKLPAKYESPSSTPESVVVPSGGTTKDIAVAG
ncbi:hypothetical protein [Tuwongella immobilis]|uniref:Carboxypeptidase regulatory-like domain-containing protein n=1 Tax=Tuwongella immobilis TaxID=692036 RepID=A0A6C2YJA9_9BACT|nr:hypothetical protein [Tuwongella immobilis]VIP01444.1 Uncharacterized protein OS=Planctomyces brasiliensis (strain ATCC 49424 / DSM 5305 / JCM 21570 / NBRC 103401 / IFAM 1448) GN=Plabr_4594 PE=4 SV=1 [Tuwongella immobilis]VTR98424.1 Uncharacterized protein OS=Planctomyces brasiliensis (strain ATCC 49424 / DSM 5305 / JCM 21570 / NBRC 103401 / IFAM 1448) GN=Plabr_4594 PE=4 SV=1 [Tuwongella immobilis]